MTDPILITGGAGFIGTHLVHNLLDTSDATIVNIDKLTYAADHVHHRRLAHECDRYTLEEVDISDIEKVEELVLSYRPRVILNLAAESHVDRSIDAAGDFVATNYVGTYSLLNASLATFRTRPSSERERFRFVQVSTDEVFGDIDPAASATTDSPMRPSSPYAATKAGADLLVSSYWRTHGLPAVSTHSSNNYGPRQHPEKLIPVVIATAISGQPIPLYGDGRQTRDWIHVTDHVNSLLAVIEKSEPGRSYLVGGGNSMTNREIVSRICEILDAIVPLGRSSYSDQVSSVPDRPGHDVRYSIDDSQTRHELDWSPRVDFSEGLIETVRWFVDNPDWWQPESGYVYERLGGGDQ